MRMQFKDMLKSLQSEGISKDNEVGKIISSKDLEDDFSKVIVGMIADESMNVKKYFKGMISEIIENNSDLALILFIESTVKIFGERKDLRVTIGQVLDVVGIKDYKVLVDLQNAISKRCEDPLFFEYLCLQAPSIASSIINSSANIRENIYILTSNIAEGTEIGGQAAEGFGMFVQRLAEKEDKQVFNAILTTINPKLFVGMPLESFGKQSIKAMFKSIAEDSNVEVNLDDIKKQFGDALNTPETILDIANSIMELAQDPKITSDQMKVLREFYNGLVVTTREPDMQKLVDACLRHPVRVAALKDQELSVSQQAKAVSILEFDQMLELCKGIQLNPVAKAVVRIIQFITNYDFSKEMSEVVDTASKFMNFVGVTPQIAQGEEKAREPQTAMEKVIAKFFRASTFAEKAAKGQEHDKGINK